MPARHKGARRPQAIVARLVGSGLLLALMAALPAKADYAVLRSGQRLHIAGWQNLGDKVRLDMKGGSVTIDAAELARIEPEDVFGESAKTELDVDVPYADQIQNAARTYRIDPALVASVIAVESNFNSRAVSRKSALGLMQLLPGTAAEMDCGTPLIRHKTSTAGHVISSSYSIVMATTSPWLLRPTTRVPNASISTAVSRLSLKLTPTSIRYWQICAANQVL